MCAGLNSVPGKLCAPCNLGVRHHLEVRSLWMELVKMRSQGRVTGVIRGLVFLRSSGADRGRDWRDAATSPWKLEEAGRTPCRATSGGGAALGHLECGLPASGL